MRGPDPEVEQHELAEAEQTLADADQTQAESDQTAADQDEVAADCDQLATIRSGGHADLDLPAGAIQRPTPPPVTCARAEPT